MMSGYHRLQTGSGQPMQRTYLPPPGIRSFLKLIENLEIFEGKTISIFVNLN